MSSVFWIGADGALMEYDGTTPPKSVKGIMVSEVMTMEEARKKYPDFFPKKPDIVAKLEDLRKQATVERSHNYVGSVVREAITEINRLREIEWMYENLNK